MTIIYHLTPQDPLVSRDGRPFGVDQGARMKGLPWILPSVVAGSFRTALGKSQPAIDFSLPIRKVLLDWSVAGLFPCHNGSLLFPSPLNAVAEPDPTNGSIHAIHRLAPIEAGSGGSDMPVKGLLPVMLGKDAPTEDFKPAALPAWWPLPKMVEWLCSKKTNLDPTFLNPTNDHPFLEQPKQKIRDHVALDAGSGASLEGRLFTSVGLSMTHLPIFGASQGDPFPKRFAPIDLSIKVTPPKETANVSFETPVEFWQPMGGERRLVHWRKPHAAPIGWDCPNEIRSVLSKTNRVALVLATPAIFAKGWRPAWINEQLHGKFHGVGLKLVGVCNGRWKAVSGWSMAPPIGPKPIRRMVPAGSVYFFELDGSTSAEPLSAAWLESVSDLDDERKDGFGLALWGTW